MASEVAEIIDRMILVLKSNGAIWDEKDREDRLHSIDYGEEDNLMYDKPAPYVLVTIPDSPYVTAEQYGRSADTKIQDRLEFVIKIISDTNSSENTERELSRYLKEVVGTISGNRTLKHPTDTQSPDPKCSRLYITRYGILPQYRGKELQIAEIVVRCQIGDQITLSIGNISDLSLIGETGGIGRTYKRRSDDAGNTKLSKGQKEGTKYWEYEHNKSAFDSIQTLIDDGNVISATVKSGQIARTYNGIPVYQRDTLRYDGLPVVILQFEVER